MYITLIIALKDYQYIQPFIAHLRMNERCQSTAAFCMCISVKSSRQYLHVAFKEENLPKASLMFDTVSKYNWNVQGCFYFC